MNQKNRDIDESLLLKYLLGNADEAEHSAVEVWLGAGSNNKKELDRLESLWLETGRLKPAPVAVDTDAAWQKVAARIDRMERKMVEPAKSKTSIGTIPTRYLIAVAASITLLFGLYLIFRLINPREDNREMVTREMALRDTLPDGSLVTLNQNSKLTVPMKFKKGTREVTVDGEAFFKVKKDALKPFIVHAGTASIRVLGTTFSAKSSPGMVVVNVVEGRVMFFKTDPADNDTMSVILAAGDAAEWPDDSAKPVRRGASPPDGHFWADRTLDFRNTPLAEALPMIERHYAVKISVSSQSILSCRITALFEDEPVDRVLAVIAESFDLELQTRGTEFHLTGEGCP